MEKYFVEVLVDKEQLFSNSGFNNIHDAFNSEFGWLSESGIKMTDWIKVDKDKSIRGTF